METNRPSDRYSSCPSLPSLHSIFFSILTTWNRFQIQLKLVHYAQSHRTLSNNDRFYLVNSQLLVHARYFLHFSYLYIIHLQFPYNYSPVTSKIIFKYPCIFHLFFSIDFLLSLPSFIGKWNCYFVLPLLTALTFLFFFALKRK